MLLPFFFARVHQSNLDTWKVLCTRNKKNNNNNKTVTQLQYLTEPKRIYTTAYNVYTSTEQNKKWNKKPTH